MDELKDLQSGEGNNSGNGKGSEDAEYVIERLVDHAYQDGKLVFKVKWYGYPTEDAAWKSIAQLLRSAVVTYFRRKNNPAHYKPHTRDQDELAGGRVGEKRDEGVSGNLCLLFLLSKLFWFVLVLVFVSVFVLSSREALSPENLEQARIIRHEYAERTKPKRDREPPIAINSTRCVSSRRRMEKCAR